VKEYLIVRNHWLRMLFAVAAGLTLASCSSNDPSVSPGSGASAGTAEEQRSASLSGKEQSTRRLTFTPAGAALPIGDKATVPFKSKNNNGAVGITVTKIDKGDPAELATLMLGDKVVGMVPYYIRVQVSNESGSAFAHTSLRALGGVLADGRDAQKVSVIGSFAECDRESAGIDFITPGATYETCSLVLAPNTTTVTRASYADSGAAEQGQDYSRKPITWG
jgi:hypothetical protein